MQIGPKDLQKTADRAIGCVREESRTGGFREAEGSVKRNPERSSGRMYW